MKNGKLFLLRKSKSMKKKQNSFVQHMSYKRRHMMLNMLYHERQWLRPISFRGSFMRKTNFLVLWKELKLSHNSKQLWNKKIWLNMKRLLKRLIKQTRKSESITRFQLLSSRILMLISDLPEKLILQFLRSLKLSPIYSPSSRKITMQNRQRLSKVSIALLLVSIWKLQIWSRYSIKKNQTLKNWTMKDVK